MLDNSPQRARERAMSDFLGGEAARAAAEPLIDFLTGEIAAFEAENGIDWDSPVAHDTLREVWKMSAARGFYSYLLPTELGGQGLSVADICAVREAALMTGSVLAAHVLGDLSGPPRVGHLFKQASPHQVETFLQPIQTADLAVCFALTEAGAGSDAAAIQTRADKTADGYVLNGVKRFISGGSFADIAIVLAVTDPEAGAGGISAFFVDLHAPGASKRKDYEVLSGKGAHADLVFENVHVPAENLIGREGTGFRLGMARISVNRLLHCSTMMGFARLALTLSVERAGARQQFGRPIGTFQAIQHMLADMATDLYAGRAMMFDAARRLDAGHDIRAEASMCKLFCAENGFRIADRAMQVHGGVGLLKGGPIEFIFRNLRTFRIVTGTSEIQKNTIAKALLDRAG
ncbi:acyl-CoA dehydrogenase family protein [Albibacillus kandeliae]|uniref:acyl-CoA dehydrogenase family protein n=1 Tax=Albibacillus kandeliae TaxID=2174228 RepID=UPI0018E50926|nr:acyl-CoA dehydrogenase family protein [Albibacillus kandeliae]